MQWRFPKLCYEYGGGAFLIPYFIALFFFTVPLVVLEMALGQRYQVSHVRMMALAASGAPSSSGGSSSDITTASFAGGLGWSAVLGTFLLSQFYCALLSITFTYLLASLRPSLPWTGGSRAHDYFLNVTWPSEGVEDVGGLVPGLLGGYMLVYALVAAGAANNSASIELLNKLVMPVPFVVLLVFLIRGLTLEGAADGVAALFTPDPDKLGSADIWLAAVSQLFFGVSAGLGTLTTYASFMPRDTPIVGSAILVCLGNSAFSLLAGITVFAFLGNLAHIRDVPVTSVGRRAPSLCVLSRHCPSLWLSLTHAKSLLPRSPPPPPSLDRGRLSPGDPHGQSRAARRSRSRSSLSPFRRFRRPTFGPSASS